MVPTWKGPPLLVITILALSTKRAFGFFSAPSNREHDTCRNTTVVIDQSSRDESCIVDVQQNSDEPRQCSIFLAPSSLIGSTGFGIFTTRDIERGSNILSAPDGPSIPVVDISAVPRSKERDQWLSLFDGYWWGDYSSQVSFEASQVFDYQIMFGALINHHCILESVEHRYPETEYDDSLVHRQKDPGAGAFSYSMGREFFASRDVKAGSELFLNYGHCTRDEETLRGWPWTAFIPMTSDYNQAARICWKYLHPLPDAPDDEKIIAPMDSNEFVPRLLPESTSQLRSIIETSNETISSERELAYHLAKHMVTKPRDTAFIREHGMCLENLVPRKSGLPHAGQGGFAQYFVRKGEVVVPMPMLHIVDRDVLLMHPRGNDDDDDDGSEKDDMVDGSKSRFQLLLNYCFGHNESSILLCPETNAILINHCSQRMKQCGPKGPNAEYRWSSGWEQKSDELQNMTIEEIAEQPGRGLSMEIVALRNIKPGEEVFIDYGAGWEDAWEAHVASWKHPDTDDSQQFISAKEANEQQGPLEYLVSGNIRNASEHSYLFTGCKYRPSTYDTSPVWYEEDGDWISLSDEELLDRFADNGARYRYFGEEYFEYWPCTIISQDRTGSYIVRIHQNSIHPQQIWDVNNLPRLLTNYPQESIRYFVKPYANDQNLPSAFRHYIPIRDEIFPVQWKNRLHK